ncbi:MAG: hypothetical protein DRR19_10270 [Candidatus Parabeggiatoa sp. nov. 1]|nr:MAG: hypothetical protein DRR19_10270 [Gammaproteobacteria bacterium]
MNDADKMRLSELPQEFVQASLIERTRSIKEEEERRQRELQTAQKLAEESEARRKAEENARYQAEQRVAQQATANKKLQKRAIVLALSLMMAIGAGVLAWFNQQQTEAQRIKAEEQRKLAEERRIEADEQRQVAEEQRNKAFFSQSLRLANLARQEINNGDFINGILLTLEALPENIFDKIPYANEAEIQLKRAILDMNSAILDMNSAIFEMFDMRRTKSFFPNIGKKVIFNKNSIKIITFNKKNIYIWDIKNGKLLNLIEMDNIRYPIFSSDNESIINFSQRLDLLLSRPVIGETIKLSKLLSNFLFLHGTNIPFYTPGLKNGFNYFSILNISPKNYNANLWNTNKAKVFVDDKNSIGTPITKFSDNSLINLSIGSQIFATSLFKNPEVHLWEIKSGKLFNKIGIPSTLKKVFQDAKKTSYMCKNMELSEVIHVNYVELSPDNRYIIINYKISPKLINCCSSNTFSCFSLLGTFFVWEIDSNAKIIDRLNILSKLSSKYFKNNTHFTPNSKFFVNFDYYNELFIWELSTSKRVNQFKVDHRIIDMYFSPDSRFLATINFNPNDDYGKSIVYLLELNSGEVFKKLKGHVNEVYDLTFSPDGKYLVTTSTDSIRLWEVSSGELINAIEWHKYVINNLSFTPDDKAIFSASKINTTQKLIEHAKKIVPRCLTKDQRKKFFLPPRQSHTLIEKGEKRAQIGQIDEAIALFEQARKLEYCHKFNPKKISQLIYVNTLFETGEKFARTGHIEEALAQFKQAQALVYYFAPKNNDQYLEKREILAIQEKREKIIASFPQQQGKIDPEFEFIASLLKRKQETSATICRYGSLYGYAAKVIEFCDKAVALATKGDCHIRDSRALARALTGNIKGAIKDFQSFVASDCEDDDESKKQRQRWIEVLRRGENPFTPEELERLRSE